LKSGLSTVTLQSRCQNGFEFISLAAKILLGKEDLQKAGWMCGIRQQASIHSRTAFTLDLQSRLTEHAVPA
jgi:hypothetical protein